MPKTKTQTEVNEKAQSSISAAGNTPENDAGLWTHTIHKNQWKWYKDWTIWPVKVKVLGSISKKGREGDKNKKENVYIFVYIKKKV